MNVDYAQTILDLAGAEAHPRMQGRSLLPLLRGEHPEDWRQAVYYRYFEHLDVCHNVQASYGIRTHTHKLIHYPGHGSGRSTARRTSAGHPSGNCSTSPATRTNCTTATPTPRTRT